MYNIFTVSRYDVYDYLRCPKIVALKTYKNLKKPTPKKKINPNRNFRYEIGTIGELITQKTFSDEDFIREIPTSEAESSELNELDVDEYETEYELESLVEKQALPAIRIDLKKKGVLLDSQMNNILKNTIIGLGKIKSQLTEKYGKIEILGHGESRSGILPNKVRPDFIAISEEQKPVMIEVKNTSNINTKADHFQASFYNTIAKKYGVIVMEERTENGIKTIIPRSINDRISETLLVYPRHGKFEKITDTTSLDKNLVKDIWIAKQLGLKGKTPKTDCDSKCPHHRHGDLPEGNLEPAIPLPLVVAEGLIEQGVDLDTDYLRRYLWRNGIGRIIDDGLYEIRHAEFLAKYGSYNQPKIETQLKKLEKKKDAFLEEIVEKTGFTMQEISKITSKEASLAHVTEQKKAEKEMKDAFAPWKKLLGAKNLKLLRNTAKGQSTRLYPIPKDSKRFVKRSWKLWD